MSSMPMGALAAGTSTTPCDARPGIFGPAPSVLDWPHTEHLSSIETMHAPPWKTPVGVDAVVERWLSSGYVRPCLAADRLYREAPARVAPFPERLHVALRRALERRGVTEL